MQIVKIENSLAILLLDYCKLAKVNNIIVKKVLDLLSYQNLGPWINHK